MTKKLMAKKGENRSLTGPRFEEVAAKNKGAYQHAPAPAPVLSVYWTVVSVAEQAGLSMTFSENPKTGFVGSRPNL